MKYNFRVDDGHMGATHGMILSHVNPGSRVLECGCATGYMTKYMSETLGCEVSIIEKDPGGYDAAIPYAVSGCCGNLLREDTWWHFEGKRFDYILFADVLEHLTDPIFAVEHARKLLADDGRMIVSIPNITHNDIIIGMMNDSFTYTDTGLLDDTHVHFWGRGDFRAFAVEAGMEIETEQHMNIPTCCTEQRFPAIMVDKDVMRVLKARKYGEVYQFIFVMKKKD